MLNLFNLTVPPDRTRSGLDAILDLDDGSEPIPFELKSTTSKSVATVRDFGPDHIVKWRHLHWLFAFYERDATTLRHCYYASPADMADGSASASGTSGLTTCWQSVLLASSLMPT